MKWDKYNTIKIIDNKYYLYNCATEKLMVLDQRLSRLIIERINHVDSINSIDSKLYLLLKHNKFIVEDDFDEIKDFVDRMQQRAASEESFKIIINPTLDCNLRCWYCYENHKKYSVVNDTVLNSILQLIGKKVESPLLKQMHIAFFGGEPLMRFNKVIWPILEFAQKICKQNKKELIVSFTTNGVLLTKRIIDKLYEGNFICQFQVPFDGNEEFHNKTKKYENGKGAYETTLHNVMYGLSKGFSFIIRCNYTPESLYSFEELISLFSEVADECIKYGILSFNFKRVWQVNETAESSEILNRLENKISLQQTNFTELSGILFERCYADNENSVVINYNGDVYNCTAQDFRPEEREGYLNEEGLIIYNKKHHDRMKARFSNENCLKCNIFPICNNCSQKKLEMRNKNIPCVRMATEEEKEKLLLARIKMVAKSFTEKQILSI